MDIDPQHGKYMSCLFMFRGDMTPKEVNTALAKFNGHEAIPFVSWSPVGIKVSSNAKRSLVLPNAPMHSPLNSVAVLGNSSSMSRVLRTLNDKFDLLFGRRAFVHWYTEEVLTCNATKLIGNGRRRIHGSKA